MKIFENPRLWLEEKKKNAFLANFELSSNFATRSHETAKERGGFAAYCSGTPPLLPEVHAAPTDLVEIPK